MMRGHPFVRTELAEMVRKVSQFKDPETKEKANKLIEELIALWTVAEQETS